MSHTIMSSEISAEMKKYNIITGYSATEGGLSNNISESVTIIKIAALTKV